MTLGHIVVALLVTVCVVNIYYLWRSDRSKAPTRKSQYEMETDRYWENMSKLGYNDNSILYYFEDFNSLEELQRANLELEKSLREYQL